MKSNYNDCLTRLLKDEGGYSNTPGDDGGPTNFGITLVDYQKYINKNGTAENVKHMSVDQAKAIYKSKYWDALNCDNLSGGVDYTVFDYGVNSGLGRPRKALSKFKSLAGAKLIDAVNDERMTFLRTIGVGHNAQFLKGWTDRVTRVRNVSKDLAKKDYTTGPAVVTGLGSLGLVLYNYLGTHKIEVLVGVAIAAIAIGVVVHFIKNKGK